MADLLSNSIPKFPLFNPPNLFSSLAPLSRTTTAGTWRRRRRRRRKSPQIILFCKPSSQDLAVISTHEHSDGSVIFRFGDPSELAKEDELVKSKPEKVEEFTVVKVLDGDCEREIIVKNERLTNATVTEVSDSVVSRSEHISLLESDIESDEQFLENSYDYLASSVNQTGLLDHYASEVITKNDAPLDEILVEKDEGQVSIELTDNVEVQVEQGDRELSEKSASEACMTNVVTLEEIIEEKASGEASIPLTDNVEVQAEQGDRELSEKSASEACMTNVVALEEIIEEKASGEASIPLTDNVEVQAEQVDRGSVPLTDNVEVEAEQGDRASNEKFAPELSLPLEEIVVVKDDGEALISLTDNGSSSVEVPADRGNRESSEKSTSENIVTLEEIVIEKDESEASISPTEESGSESTIQSVSSDIDSSMDVTVNYVHQETSEDDESIKQSAIEDSGENQTIKLSKDVEDQNTQIGIIEDSREDEVAEPILDEVSQDIQELYEPDKTERPMSLNNNSPNLLLEEEQTEDVESSVPAEALGHGMVEVESNGAPITNEDIQTAKFVLSSGAALLPHPSKALTGGEDAYFVTSQNWLGIADGVGQWSLEGIYPGVYAKELMENCEKVILQCDSDSGTDPKLVLKLSVAKVESPGSSTALIARFDGQALDVANIGDSGFIIIRNGVIHKKSSPMLHEFNFPMQIERGDDPSQIVEGYRVELDEGDIVVTGTDGLFDNLYAQEIASITIKSLEANKTPKEIAEILATRAQEVGGATSGRSPFSDATQAAGYVGHTGGKLDDIAVIVSLVQNPTH